MKNYILKSEFKSKLFKWILKSFWLILTLIVITTVESLWNNLGMDLILLTVLFLLTPIEYIFMRLGTLSILRITPQGIEKGEKHFTKGFQVIDSISKENLIDIDIIQAEDKYFEIWAVSEKVRIKLDRDPNLNPAKDKKVIIETKLNRIWNNVND